jgi:hypothetical protein
MHYHAKILCKNEAINWWIEQSEIPSSETKEVTDDLKQHRNKTAAYYGINWAKSRIR